MSDRMGIKEAIDAAYNHKCWHRNFMNSSKVIFSLVYELRCDCGWAVHFGILNEDVLSQRLNQFRRNRVGFLAELSGLLVVKDEIEI